MTKTFKRFLQEELAKVAPKKSIEYIEDLPVNEFISAIENLNNYIVTEKLDGTALLVGFDNSGKFYTSRSGKGSDKLIYDSADYGTNAAANVFKAAHEALKSVEKNLKRLIQQGEAYDIEILYGTQPNAITYNSPGVNYIAFLKATIGTDQSKPLDHSRVIKIGQALKDVKTTVNINGVDTSDGIELVELPIITAWQFMAPKFVKASDLGEIDVKTELSRLKEYLNQTNSIASSYLGKPVSNGELAGISMTDVPTESKDAVKSEKEQVEDVVKNDYIMNIKDIMLGTFIREYSGSMHGGEIEQHESVDIEGLVFLNPKTNVQFKLIDAEVFKEINQFNYKIRRTIKGKILTDNPSASLSARGGIYGSAMARIIGLLNIPGLAAAGTTKKTLMNFKGATEKDTVDNVVKSMVGSPNYNSIKTKILAIIVDTEKNITDALMVFNREHKDYKLELKNGKTVKYTDEIVKRTMLTFAEARKTLTTLHSDIARTSSMSGIINVLFSNQIKSIHGIEQ